MVLLAHSQYRKEFLEKHLALRVYEDVGYMYYARGFVIDNYLPQLNLNYFDSGSVKGEVSEKVKDEILQFIKNNYSMIYDKYYIDDCYMPWCRMFEVALIVKKR